LKKKKKEKRILKEGGKRNPERENFKKCEERKQLTNCKGRESIKMTTIFHLDIFCTTFTCFH
jgi:hypothetical protein